jgi:hypothetical protein
MKTFFRSEKSALPRANVRNLCVAVCMDPLSMENIATTPPTTLYIPKSDTPNDRSITLLVYKVITIRSIDLK